MTDRVETRRSARARARTLVDELGLHHGHPALWLAAMLATVLALAAAHVGHVTTGRPTDWYWNLGEDRGYGEFLGYLQAGWGVIFLTVASWWRRAPVLLAWALVLFYYLLDDSLRLHEHYGWTLARATGWYDRWGNTGGDLGELAYLALVGLGLAAVVAVAHALSRPQARRVSWNLVVLFVVFAVVGIGLDAVAALLAPGTVLDVALVVLEDGGELVVLSVIVAYLLRVADEARPAAAARPAAEAAAAPPTRRPAR